MNPFDEPIIVQVLPPSSPFSGVQVVTPSGFTRTIELMLGSPVQSVFGRVGNVTPECGDYDQCYAPLGSGLPPGGSDGEVLTKSGDAPFEAVWAPASGGGDIEITGNILMGDAAGNAVAAPFDAGQVVTKNEVYPTPTTLNEVIACLQANGLCA